MHLERLVVIMSRPKNKCILVLIEGKTEREMLERPLSKIIRSSYPENENIVIDFLCLVDTNQSGGDITSKYGVNSQNIEKIINKLFIDPYLERNRIYPKEIEEIIHIVDMDGAYIKDEYVINDTNCAEPQYTERGILTRIGDKIIERNLHKRDNLDYLISLDRINVYQNGNIKNKKSVKYSIYYFSANIDHMVHKKPNNGMCSKMDDAIMFSCYVGEDLNRFYDFFCKDSDSCLNMSYSDSWNYIRRDLNSLNRHTNINVLIEKYYKQRRDEAKGE